MRFLRLALMLLLAVGALTRRARAEDARFEWRGPACASSEPELERRLAELVGPPERARMAGSVAITQREGRYDVEITIDLDGHRLGTRHFEAKDCAKAAATAAVAASLAVYDGAGEPKGAAESSIRPDIWTRSPEPVPDFSRPRPAASTPPPPLFDARVAVLGLIEVGVLPKPAWGGALELELGVGDRWSFAALGSMTWAQESVVREQQLVSLTTWSGSARACAAPLLGIRYRLDGCAGAQLMQARGHGATLDVNRSAVLTWLAPLLGIDFSVRAPSYIEWRWELEGALPLSRPGFLVDGGEVSRAAPVVAAARLGVVLRF